MRCDRCWNNAQKEYVLTNKETDEVEDVSYLCDDCLNSIIKENKLLVEAN